MIDLLAHGTTRTAAPPPAAVPPPPELPPALRSAAVAIRTIVIDPGHGGDDEGVHGAKACKEKDLDARRRAPVKAAIEARLGVRVLLTRDDDRQVPLDERTAVANNNKADLFISLHANASLRPATAGASIYVAAFAEASRAIRGVLGDRVPAFGGGSRDIELVLWDLAQMRHVEQSDEFADILEQLLHDRVPLATPPVDRAPFRVLESANMPAVLIEMGYLTNPDQEKQLAADAFQTAFVQAVVDAVVRFRDTLSGRGTR